MSEDEKKKEEDSLTVSKMLYAYKHGAFPMAIEEEDYRIDWFYPKMRCVIPIDGFHTSRSLRRTIRKGIFDISIDRDFDSVIRNCGAPRPESPGCWLSEELIEMYIVLHRAGVAHSVEVWYRDRLAGGLFGVVMGGVFSGESMFHRVTDASKVALWATNEILKQGGFTIFDVQLWSSHLGTFGAKEVPHEEYLLLMEDALKLEGKFKLPERWSL